MTTKKITVVLDCDDVLYECNSQALAEINRRKGYQLSLRGITQWGRMNNLYDERLDFFCDPTFVIAQRLYPDAQEFVRYIMQCANVILVSDVPPQCQSARRRAIARDFPYISDVRIGNKHTVKGIADFALDDSVLWLDRIKPTVPVVFAQPWNVATELLRVQTYSDFCQIIERAVNPFALAMGI